MNTIDFYKGNISTFPKLTAEQEKALAIKVQAGDESAREDFINSNLKLVFFVAKKYQHRGLDFEDLIMEGNLGLIKAVERFNPVMDTRFSTFAVLLIEQAIRRGIANKSHTIRIPVHFYTEISKLNATIKALGDTLGHEPTVKEIADEMKISVARVNRIIASKIDTLSLDAKVGEDQTTTLGELIAIQEKPTDVIAFENIKKGEIADLIKSLTDEKEIAVIKFRFGFDENDPHSLEDIGKKLGLCRERIRQIEQNALGKLREKLAA